MKASLLVLAAGLGSRFGGDKQISHVGPNGEFLMEYSIHDALKAGFEKVVFILKNEMVEAVKREVGDKISDKVEVCYAVQDYSTLPDWYSVPEKRVKPFGTVHAVLAAKEFLTEPFVTVNADDYYGAECFEIMMRMLPKTNSGCAAMVPYILKNTVSENGGVTRGVCNISGGRLMSVNETGGIYMDVTDVFSGGHVSGSDKSTRLMQFRPQLYIGANGMAMMSLYQAVDPTRKNATLTIYVPQLYFGSYELSWEGDALSVKVTFAKETTISVVNSVLNMNTADLSEATVITLTETGGKFASGTVVVPTLGEVVFTKGTVV